MSTWSITSFLTVSGIASVKDFKDVMAVNAEGVFLCYKHAGRKMVEQGRGGRIIGA